MLEPMDAMGNRTSWLNSARARPSKAAHTVSTCSSRVHVLLVQAAEE